MREHHYPSLGRCIYCGKDDVPLSDEHIIPLALQGLLVFDDASCSVCAKITNSFEAPVIASLEHFRTRYNVRTRRRKARKTSFTLTRTDGSAVTIPANEVPTTAFLYKFGRANILRGLPPFDPTFEWLLVPYYDHNAMRHAIERFGWDGHLKFNARPHEFARLIAKIGYSYALAELGFDAFKPLCLDMIMGQAANYSYLVGGSLDITPTPNSTGDHYIGIGLIEQSSLPKLVVVPIRLFQQMGSPHHYVIVGRVESEAQLTRIKAHLEGGEAITFPGV